RQCPLPPSSPPWCPPLGKPTEASSRGAESQSADVTARELGRREQRRRQDTQGLPGETQQLAAPTSQAEF
ncbi:unnamed protein product, partial [Rangifer tarandus platyrhynchus]